mgnify:CR=1 FL=1
MSELSKRIFVAAVGIPLALFIIYTGGILFYATVVIISAWALYEYYGLCDKTGVITSKNFAILAGVLLQIFIISLINGNSSASSAVIGISFAIILFIIIADILFSGRPYPILSFASTFSGLIYIPLMLVSLIGIREFGSISSQLFKSYDEIGLFVIYVFASVWICDSAAYFIGKAFGKHKLFERVSPKKTWEGAAAGFTASVIFFGAIGLFTGIIPVYHALVIGAIAGTVGQIGDLFESMLKRDAGVKDSSNLLPGHGGMLDRFDSMIFVSPFVFMYLTLVVFAF